VPKGQAWAGTDRQVRGAIVAVLREAHAPVPRSVLLEAPVDLAMVADGVRITAAPDPLSALHRLRAPAEQLDRALAGLLADGLAEEADGGLRLPG
jgi:A/G-specific adenine glycosylase